jgi:hypothetical protein
MVSAPGAAVEVDRARGWAGRPQGDAVVAVAHQGAKRQRRLKAERVVLVAGVELEPRDARRRAEDRAVVGR